VIWPLLIGSVDAFNGGFLTWNFGRGAGFMGESHADDRAREHERVQAPDMQGG